MSQTVLVARISSRQLAVLSFRLAVLERLGVDARRPRNPFPDLVWAPRLPGEIHALLSGYPQSRVELGSEEIRGYVPALVSYARWQDISGAEVEATQESGGRWLVRYGGPISSPDCCSSPYLSELLKIGRIRDLEVERAVCVDIDMLQVLAPGEVPSACRCRPTASDLARARKAEDRKARRNT